MGEIDSSTLIMVVTVIVAGVGILGSTITLAIVEGRAVLKALEGMTRQPEAANSLRTSLIIGMALLETSAIYVLLVIIILTQLLGNSTTGG